MNKLIFVLGAPGCGKTTLARELVRATNAVYICSDTVYDPLIGSDRASAAYLTMRPKVYDIIYDLAKDNLGLGNAVIVDAPHMQLMVSPEWRAKVLSLALAASASVKLIRVFCSEQILRTRIASRASDRDHEKRQDWQAFLKDQPIMFEIPLDHLDVDSEQALSEQVAASLAYLSL